MSKQKYPMGAGEKTCSICQRKYRGFGNNAAPFRGRCCDACNANHVIPARLRLMYASWAQEEGSNEQAS